MGLKYSSECQCTVRLEMMPEIIACTSLSAARGNAGPGTASLALCSGSDYYWPLIGQLMGSLASDWKLAVF